MQNNIENILADLYLSDPSLKQHEAVLRKLVAELMEARPDTQFDEQFRQDLRRKLMALAETNAQSPNKSLSAFFMKRFQLAGAGVALIALLAVSAWYLNGIKTNTPSSLTTMLAAPKITRISDNAFGSLANITQNVGMGGGGGGSSAESSAPTAAPAGMGGGGADSKMIAPYNPVNFNYVYAGEPLTLAEGKADVLKRQKGDGSGISEFVNRISLGLIDLTSFGSTKLQSFSFVEDKDLGYMVNVNTVDGSVNINENWIKWAQTYPACARPLDSVGLCPEPRRVKIEDVPADQVLIDASNAFLQQHGIPATNYGEPFVNNDWRAQYERAADKSAFWIPDSLQVVYPLMLNGDKVYDESGNVNGMNVTVRFTPEVNVSGVWELTTQNYQSSSYDAETSVDRVMKLVAKGGFRNYYYDDPKAKTVDIELGTPTVSYVKVWNFRNNESEELLVPSLIFPVTKDPDPAELGQNYWYRKNVVIPLVKEILDNENGDGPIRIMPAAEGGDAIMSEPAATGTSTK